MPRNAFNQTLLSAGGDAQKIVARCFDNDTSTSCFNKSTNVNITSLSADYECVGSGVDSLDSVQIYNTKWVLDFFLPCLFA